MLYLSEVDAMSTVSHSGSKFFQILSFGLTCVGISWEDGNKGHAMAQQFSSSPNLLPPSCSSIILEGSIRNRTAHITTRVYCTLRGNALVPDRNSFFEIPKDWHILIFYPNDYDYQQTQQPKPTSPSK